MHDVNYEAGVLGMTGPTTDPKPLWAVVNDFPNLAPGYHETIEVLQYYFDFLGSKEVKYDAVALNKAIFRAGLVSDTKTWTWFRFCIENFNLYFSLAPIDWSVME